MTNNVSLGRGLSPSSGATVRNVSGTSAVSGPIPIPFGAAVNFQTGPGFFDSLTLGNAGAVEVAVNGYPLDLGQKEGEVVRDLLIDLGTVQALREKKEAR